MLGVFQKNYSCEHLDRFFFLCCFKRPGHLGAQNPRNAIWFRDFCSNFREVQTHCESQAAVLPAQEVICLDNFSNQTTSSNGVIKFWKTCWMKWDFGEDFCFSDLVSNLKKSQCPTVLFFSRQDEYVRNSPKFPNLTQKKHHQLEGQFLSSFSREFFNGRFEDFPLVFFLVCAVFDRKNYTKGKDLEDICLDLGWLGWRKKGLGGLGSWRDVKYGVPTDM